MAYLFGIWVCFIAFAAAALSRLLVIRRIRTDHGARAGASPGAENEGKTNFGDLLREHKSRFPASRTGTLAGVLIGAQLLATAAGLVLGIAAQFQPHSLFLLISAAR